MVIVIHQTANTENAFLYNEKKVNEGVATFFQSRNTKAVNPFLYDKKHRLKEFLDIEKINPRVKNKCLHISLNPSSEDYLKLNDKIIHQEIGQFMEHMGYGKQPYFVYKHKDLERVHFHIVSSRIDRHTGKKIKDNYEYQKAQRFIKELEQKYQLTYTDSKEKPVFKFSAKSRNIKQSLENLFQRLNQMETIASKAMYNEALKLFNVEIKKSGRGHIVLVTDGEGKAIRYPIRLSKFKEKPNFYISESQAVAQNQIEKEPQKINKGLKFAMIKKLIWQVGIQANREPFTRNSKYRTKRKKGKKK